jgi:hypothetical protein
VAEHTRLGSTVGDVPGAVLGFIEDVDIRPADGVRVAQLTPPGSACSVTTGLCQGRRCGRQGQSGISDPSLHHARRHALRKQHLLTGPVRPTQADLIDGAAVVGYGQAGAGLGRPAVQGRVIGHRGLAATQPLSRQSDCGRMSIQFAVA